MERTKRYKTDGGDTAWEEKKKQSYATSEVTNPPSIDIDGIGRDDWLKMFSSAKILSYLENL